MAEHGAILDLGILLKIVPGLVGEVATWVSPLLEDGSENVELAEVRVLAADPAHGNVEQTRVARITWRLDTGEVEHLWVRENLRREGVATRLWDAARHLDPNVTHSAWRTDDGEAWAVKVASRDGEELPERKRA